MPRFCGKAPRFWGGAKQLRAIGFRRTRRRAATSRQGSPIHRRSCLHLSEVSKHLGCFSGRSRRGHTGDDCIAIKLGRNQDGRLRGIPSQYIIVRNCSMEGGPKGTLCDSLIWAEGQYRDIHFDHLLLNGQLVPGLDDAL